MLLHSLIYFFTEPFAIYGLKSKLVSEFGILLVTTQIAIKFAS